VQLLSSVLRQVCILALWFGCGRSVDPPSYPEPVPLGTTHVVIDREPSATVPVSSAADGRAHYQMRQQLSDLRYIEDLLVAGRVDEAAAIGDRLAPGHGGSRALATPHPMVHATTVAQASRIAAQATATCGACHQRVGARVTVGDGPAPPAGDPSRCSPRHRWAIGRLADGLTSGHDRPWRAGLDAFMGTPMSGPGSPQRRRVQEIARAGLAHFTTDTLDARAAIYSDLLSTCGGCHATARERTRHGREVL
jgi:cytochrome c553